MAAQADDREAKRQKTADAFAQLDATLPKSCWWEAGVLKMVRVFEGVARHSEIDLPAANSDACHSLPYCPGGSIANPRQI